MIYIDSKYIGLISARLPLFKRRNSAYNFRCPICGDSQNNRNKARGYLYTKVDHLLFYCHNCHASMSFGNFLKIIDPELHKQYTQEKFIDKHSGKEKAPDITKITKPKFITFSPLKQLKKVSQLEWDHPVKRYVNSRHIPNEYHARLFYAPKFKKWVNGIIPNKFDSEDVDEPRLIIPLIDQEQNCFGIQGRGFKPNGIRYITIIFDENKPKVYGLDTVDFTKKVYVLEGPIDSMFLPNAVAMAGSDGIEVISSLAPDSKDNFVFVYDNEPRNKEICKIIEKAIDRGFKVSFWPDHISSKDVNDMVIKENLTPEEIKKIIDDNTLQGLQAKMRFTTWKKV